MRGIVGSHGKIEAAFAVDVAFNLRNGKNLTGDGNLTLVVGGRARLFGLKILPTGEHRRCREDKRRGDRAPEQPELHLARFGGLLLVAPACCVGGIRACRDESPERFDLPADKTLGIFHQPIARAR